MWPTQSEISAILHVPSPKPVSRGFPVGSGQRQLVKLAQLGKPFNQLADKKTVHEAFDSFYCELTKRNETVWRFRHRDIRILFYYAADKVVLLTHTLPKRTDKLSLKDINQAKQAVIEFLTASRSAAGLQWIE